MMDYLRFYGFSLMNLTPCSRIFLLYFMDQKYAKMTDTATLSSNMYEKDNFLYIYRIQLFQCPVDRQ